MKWIRTLKNGRKKGFEKKDYWCKPVPSFGSLDSEILIVGLAPGKHGAGRTGRPFTGDYAGEILYKALYQSSLASSANAISLDDGLKLIHQYFFFEKIQLYQMTMFHNQR